MANVIQITKLIGYSNQPHCLPVLYLVILKFSNDKARSFFFWRVYLVCRSTLTLTRFRCKSRSNAKNRVLTSLLPCLRSRPKFGVRIMGQGQISGAQQSILGAWLCSTPFLHLNEEILLGAKLMEDFLLFSSIDGRSNWWEDQTDGRIKLVVTCSQSEKSDVMMNKSKYFYEFVKLRVVNVIFIFYKAPWIIM